ncbi:MAG: hypothetical protein QM811_11640 [Pirellulales bacterium]
MGFCQTDPEGKLREFPQELTLPKSAADWQPLIERMEKLLKLRVRNGKKVSGDW